MPEAGPIPVFPQGANDVPVYEYKAWPAWRVSPEGKRALFDKAEEVPDGWMTADEYAALTEDDFPDQNGEDEGKGAEDPESETAPVEPSGEEKPRELTADQRKEAVAKLMDDNTRADLVAMLDLMNGEREVEVEFAPSWGKQKLAEAIVDNGGPLEVE